MPEPTISYAPRPDATPELELNALAACYRIILESAKKRGRIPDESGPDAGKEIDEQSGKVRIPQ